MDQLTLALSDDMTLGQLRALAQGLGRRLVVSFGDGGAAPAAAPVRRGPGRPRRNPEAPAAAAPAPAATSKGGRPKRQLSPEAKAALRRNLAKARAARSANARARRLEAKRAGAQK